MMYFRSGGKGKIIEKINLIESSEGYTKLENISPVVLFVTLALEDNSFFLHKGINLHTVRKAVKVNIKKKRIVMGGSTLTQQLAKNLLFNFQKTFTRKIAELFAVAVLEKKYSKEKILEIYLNCIEYGNNNWNIKSACGFYFDRLPIEIELAQAISLLSILPSPKNYNPISNKDKYYRARVYAVDLLEKMKCVRDIECRSIKQSDFFEKALFSDDLERFYREIFRNSIRAAKESKRILSVRIDSVCTDKILNEKLNSEGLLVHAYDCCRSMRTCYMWGGMMDIVAEDIVQLLSKRYGKYYTKNKINQYRSLIGEEVYGCDCSGLIKSYLFGGVNHPTYEELYDLNSKMMFDLSEHKGKIDNLPEIRGICLYMPGHVGIYTGNGKVVECTENERLGNGVVESKIRDRNWTDWFYCPFVKYKEQGVVDA